MAAFVQPDQLKPPCRLGAAAAAFLGALVLQTLPVVQGAERLLFDLRVRWVAGRFEPRDDIVLVEIDDKSLPRTPAEAWRREVVASLVEYCREARAIGVAIGLDEPPAPGQGVRDGDSLARTIGDVGCVYLAAYFCEHGDAAGPTPGLRDRWRVAADPGVLSGWPAMPGARLPFGDLLDACRGIGQAGLKPDEDGVLRRYLALVRHHEAAIPSLALVMAMHGLGLNPGDVAVEPGGRLRLGSGALPLTPDGAFYYCPPSHRYPTVSAADVLDAWNRGSAAAPDAVTRAAFRDKLVLIGVTAPLITDFRKTSIAPAIPGVRLHAAALQGLMEGRRFRMPPPWAGWTAMAMLALAPAVRRLPRPRVLAAVGAGGVALYLLVAAGFLWKDLVMLPLIGPMAACGLSCGMLTGMHWSQDRNRRRCLEAMEAAKQQFTDMLVHDLKNTVAPIMMSLSMMDRRAPGGEPSRKDEAFWRTDFPEIVWTSSTKLLSQINALLDIRRMQEGKLQLHPTPCRPSDLMNRLLREYDIAARRSDLSLALDDAAPEDLWVEVDPSVFNRIMANLVWNAIKYARGQSEVRLGVRSAPGGRLEFFVNNEGRSISPELQRVLFTASGTGVDAASSLSMPSNGLGLAFCKLAVEAHGGDIELLSPRPGEPDGVEVRVRFAAARDERPGEGGAAGR